VITALAVAASLIAPTTFSGSDCGPQNINTCGVATVDYARSMFEGAIIVPGSEAANRAVAASGGCQGCEWTLVRRCDLNTPEDPNYVNCLGARCPDGEAYRLYLKHPAEPAPVLLDTICIGEARRIVTAAELAVDVERHVKRLRPPAHEVVVEAPGYALTHVPAFLTASGPGADTATLDVTTAAGPARLRIDVGPREYAWAFGDGGTCTTTQPGGPWDGDRTGAERCDTRVAHVYAAPGTRATTLTVTWGGTYTFDVGYGPVGPLAIPGDGVAAATASRAVDVREGRAELVGQR
jgi:hypothetical protein